MKDILGQALRDFYDDNYTDDILVETSISDADTLSLPYLFRDYGEMPKIEQKALDLCKGKVLDVGCGAGSHSLYLQNKRLDVTAIDISKGAVEITKKRGVKHVLHLDLLKVRTQQYDTVLLLMNGTGIFRSISTIQQYLEHLKSILAPDGRILIDSSDLRYMYDQNDDGSIWVPADKYYGELETIMTYKGESTPPFSWLYIDQNRFEHYSNKAKLSFEVIYEGPHFDYLARLTHA